jgi:ferredoxin
MLFIDPLQCIDCNACADECPTHAIFHEDEVPEQWQEFIALNGEMASTLPSITVHKAPLV